MPDYCFECDEEIDDFTLEERKGHCPHCGNLCAGAAREEAEARAAEWQKVGQHIVDALDPMKPSASPALVRVVFDAHRGVQGEIARLREVATEAAHWCTPGYQDSVGRAAWHRLCTFLGIHNYG